MKPETKMFWTGKILCFSMTVAFLIVTMGIQSAAMSGKGYPTETENSPSTRMYTFSGLPAGLAPAVARALQDDLPAAYRMTSDGDGFKAYNPSHEMNFEFTPTGPKVRSPEGTWTWGMTLAMWGYEGQLEPVPSARLVTNGCSLAYRRGSSSASGQVPLIEWYLNTAWGLEQGFTLSSPPPRDAAPEKHRGNEALVLELALSGTLKPYLKSNRLFLCDSEGLPVVSYAHLHTYDAQGKILPAHMELAGCTLRILVNDKSARYPITIDPWVQQAKLTASDGANGDNFGYSVSISGDTVLAGAPEDGLELGSAYIFEKPSGGWDTMTQTGKLTASDGESGDMFGYSVAISGDSAVIGAYRDVVDEKSNHGSAYVFVKPVGGWTDMTETAKLTPSDGVVHGVFGKAVHISGDTVIVGAPGNFVGAVASGAAYVFEKPDGGWVDMIQTAKLTSSDGGNVDQFGSSVTMSGDSTVVGAYLDDIPPNIDQGSAYVFEKPGGGWVDMSETAKLTASDGDFSDNFGLSVAINGDTVVAGAPSDSPSSSYPFIYSGSAYVFEKPSGGWVGMTQTAKLISSDGETGDNFGRSVAITDDMIVAGAYDDDINGILAQGSAYVFEKPVGGWTEDLEEPTKLTASDGAGSDNFGISVSVNDYTVVIGAFRDDDNGSNSGSAYLFSFCPNDPVRIGLVVYATLQDAYDIAVDGDILEIHEQVFLENLNADRDISVTLKGGYNCEYTTRTGYSTITGSVTISDGVVVFEDIIIK